MYPVLFICSKASERRREKRIQRRGKGWGKIISEEETESEIENREREIEKSSSKKVETGREREEMFQGTYVCICNI